MAIGGYFELELNSGLEFHKEAIRLNTGRNALEYLLRVNNYKKIYTPFYTCDVVLEPIVKLNVEYEFYNIDKSFYPIFNFDKIKSGEAFLYNNYFGICHKQIEFVASKTKNLIIDNAQAFYSKPLDNIDTFYSPRKFFGLPDGAYLYTGKFLNKEIEQDISYKRFEHLLGRIDTNAEDHFQTYKSNSKALSNQPIRKMSKLTQHLLSSIDYETIADKRNQNFFYTHNKLGSKNQLKLDIDKTTIPMVYPYLVENGNEIKKTLIDNKIYVATYWPNVLNWSDVNSFEYYLTNNLLAIPIDQRYDTNNLKLILDIINDN